VHAARRAAVGHVEEHWADEDPPLQGAAVDRACRSVIDDAGFGGFFTHRTGHSIDTEVHGLGPNIDSIETKDERVLLPGVGFSIEPGIYLADQFGVRSEINVYIGSSGPEVTTPNPQSQIYALLSEGWRSSSNL
jgi:Xaa-Pro aminopeptidase